MESLPRHKPPAGSETLATELPDEQPNGSEGCPTASTLLQLWLLCETPSAQLTMERLCACVRPPEASACRTASKATSNGGAPPAQAPAGPSPGR